MSPSASRALGPQQRSHAAAMLKERVYVAFTALAVLITLREHDEQPAAFAFWSLSISIAAVVCAVYVADLLSSVIVLERFPVASDHRRMLGASLGAAAVAVPPLLCVAISWLGAWSTSTGLLLAMLTILVTLTAVGVLAAHKLRLPLPQQVAVLAGEVVLALVVVTLELLSHR